MGMPGPSGATGMPAVSAVTSAPMGPSNFGTRQMQIRNISQGIKPAAPTLDAAAAADPNVVTPPGMMPPPQPQPTPQMVVQAAAALLFDNRDLIDRFVDKVLRKV